MDTTIDQQVAMDKALVPHAKRLRIGRSNFHMLSDISSKESTLQLVYDVLRLTPFFKAFLVTADVLEIYMQEFWATATVHRHSIRFKMDNNKHIVNLEYFREMLHICPRLLGQSFFEPPFEEEILAFLRFLGHSEAIRRLTDVNINKLHQPLRSFAAIINKCLTKKSSGYDSLRLSQAQILWGLYQKRNVYFAYHMWEDFVYQVEHKDTKKSNEMYYPRFTKFGALLPIELTNEDIKNSNAYKEYYAVATRATPPKPKASVRKTRSSSDTIVTPPTTAVDPRLSTSAKGKQPATTSKAKSLSALSEVAMTEVQQLKLATKRSLQQTHISQASGSGADEGTVTIPGAPDVSIDESEEEISWNSTDEEGDDDEQDDEEAQDDDDQEDEGNDKDDEEEGSDDEQASDKEAFIHPSLITHAEEETMDEESFDLIPKTPENSDDEGNGEEYLGTNVGREEGYDEEEDEDELYRYRMNEAVKVAVQIQSDRLRDEAQAENDEFLKTIDENMQKIIKKQVKEQVKVQVSKILPKIEQTVNEQLEAKVLTRSSNSNEQRNLYKALVEAYESDKIILHTYKDTITLKRRCDDDADKDEEPSAGLDWGSKRRREGKETESASTPKEKATRSTTFEMEEPSHLEFETGADDQPIVEPSQHPEWFSQQKKPPTLDRDWNKTLATTHKSIQPWISKLAKQSDSRSSFNELMDTPVHPEGQQYPHNLLKPLPLIPDSQGRRVIPFDHFINNDIGYLHGGASSRKYTTSVTKTKAADYGHIKWIEDLEPKTMWIQEQVCYDKHALWGISYWGRKCQQFYRFAVNRESARDITVRRDDDKLYKFKEGDFKRLRIQDIEDMILLLVQGKLTNLTVEERFAFNVSLRMFTKSIIIQRHVEDLQLGVESYQKKLNLTRPDTYRSYLKRKESYSAYSNPRGSSTRTKISRTVSVEVLRYDKMSKSENMGIVPTKMELLLEHTQQGISHEVSVTLTKPGRMTKQYSSHRFIANCFNAGNLKMEVNVPGSSCLIDS
nr:hypothetical protein [Tanacetum cinerariifolium]